MSTRTVVRPITSWPEDSTPDDARRYSPFAVTWPRTERELIYEAEQLGCRDDVVLQLAVTEADIRIDGGLRANANPAHPGVIVSFTSRYGPLRFSCDRYRNGRGLLGWQANARSITLGLEALRAVDRYGIGRGTEQFVGFRAVGSGIDVGDQTLTYEQAVRVLHDAAELPTDYEASLADVYRQAARHTHPDCLGGSEEAFKLVGRAWAVVRKVVNA